MVIGNLLSGVAGGATVAITIKAIDEFSDTFKKAGVGMAAMGTAATLAVTAVAALGAGMGALAISSAKSAIAFEPMDRSFKALVKDSDNFLKSLNEATKGTVSDFNLMQSANKALLLGLDQDTLPDLFKNAAIVGKAAGRTTKEAVDDITLGIGRQSKLILDNLGIIVKAEEAYDSYAASIGKVASDLTDEEKRIAFTTAAMDSLNKKAADLGGTLQEDAGVGLERMQAGFENLQKEIGVAFLPGITEAANVFSEQFFPAVQPLIPLFTELFNKIIDYLIPVFIQFLPYVIQLAEWILNISNMIIDKAIPYMEKWSIILKDLFDKVIIPALPYLEKFLGIVIDIALWVGKEIVDNFVDAINKIREFIELIKEAYDWVKKTSIGQFASGFVSGIKGTVSSKSTKVGDAIIRPNGQIIETSPQDTLIATKNPGGMGGGVTLIVQGNLIGLDENDIARRLNDYLASRISL